MILSRAPKAGLFKRDPDLAGLGRLVYRAFMADTRGALEMTRQRVAISRELITQSRRHLRSAAAHLDRSGAAIAVAQRLIDRTARPHGDGPRSSSATPPA